MPDNKIQDIANEITAYKLNTTLSLVKAVLEDLNAPFPEETKFYLKKLFGNIGVAYGTIEILLTIKNLLNSGVTYSGYINDWDNRQLTNETYSSPSSRNFDSLVIQKFNELFDKTRDYDQDGLYFDKDAVIRGYNVSNINLKKKLEFKNNNPIKYYIVNRYGVTSGQVTKEDLKDVVVYQCPSTLETYLYDSTGKKKFIYNGSVENGIIIFDVGE